ncbi:hypothetical protein [Larkinella sp. C7]|uniref:hypothetical protein n=1 Tax=Larkinella sp. C7 TaxID=2576607 RepID=UPI001BB188A6|nr:hypothetical protein [Larkinella sp. C7]
MNRIIVYLLSAVFFLLAPASCKKADQPGSDTSIPTRDANLALGNPSNANASQENNYLIEHPAYALSYNRSAGIANWCSWHSSAGPVFGLLIGRMSCFSVLNTNTLQSKVSVNCQQIHVLWTVI